MDEESNVAITRYNSFFFLTVGWIHSQVQKKFGANG